MDRFIERGETMINGAEVMIACLPSAVTAFCFWLLQQKITKQSRDRDEKFKERDENMKAQEKTRKKQELFFVQGISAAIVLGTATAKAVERIPDAHCNGDMHAALEYAAKVKQKQDDFLVEQGIENIYEEVK
ncbi:MAG: serine/threonine protein kinase [Clostridiales bacterium]|nr:serine/threonine protein kinase [Clostridiales bacterium]